MTGVLPIALEHATRALQAIIHSGKEYVCLMQLHDDVSRERLESILHEFVGEIYQKPPLRASVKREPRRRIVYKIEILEMDCRKVLFKVATQAGTYVRKLCSDVGEALGCGAHMSELRRIRAGPFIEGKDQCTLHELVDAYERLKEGEEAEMRRLVRPMEDALEHVPKIFVLDSAVDAICHGADLAVPGVAKLHTGIEPNMMVAILTLKGEAVALGNALMATDEILEKEKGLAAKTVRVIMPRGTYPPLWRKHASKA